MTAFLYAWAILLALVPSASGLGRALIANMLFLAAVAQLVSAHL